METVGRILAAIFWALVFAGFIVGPVIVLFRVGPVGRAAGRGVDSFTVGYFRLLWLPFWLVGRAWHFAWRWAKPGERVLPGFKWPEIYRDGERFTVIANYPLPQKTTRAANFAALGAVCMVLYRFATVPYALLNQGQNLGLVLWPAFWACVVIYVLLRFRRWTLRMRIGPDGIRWRIGWTGRGFVPPQDMADAVAEVLEQHSRAKDEQDTDALRGKPSYPVYRIASEIVMHSGFGRRDTQHIAEIHKDRNGNRAKLLQTGVNAALIAFRLEQDGQAVRQALKSMELD